MAATTLDLPALGKPDEGDVGDELELEDDVALLPRLAQQGEAGRLPAWGGQGGVAQAAATATGDDVRSAGADEVGQHFTARRPDDGAAGHPQDDVGGLGAVAVVARAGLAVGGTLVRTPVELQEGGDAGVDDGDDVAAARRRCRRPGRRAA